ncbi:MAG: hypothetical protein EBQ78_04375 [Betaproteobacteria bacterium]|nr:hypothetical protein [Betaproteobacteria bacterium]
MNADSPFNPCIDPARGQAIQPGRASRALVARIALMVWLGVVTCLGVGGLMGLAGGALARPFDTVNDRRDAA